MIVWTVFILVSFISDKRGVTRITHKLRPIYPMDLVSIPMYLGFIQGSGMDHKHQDQNQAIMASKVKIRIKITDQRPK